jgi:transposase InsO family protein
LERQRLSKDEQTVQTIIELVDAIRRQLPKIGARKLLFLLMDQLATRGITIGRDRFFRVLREHGLLVYPTRPFKVHTTNSKHWYRKYPNLIKDVVPTRANELWVADITYVTIEPQFRYLSLITDAYSHKIVGYDLSESLSAAGPLRALEQALAQRKPEPNGSHLPLIHHSDRGIQYCSYVYTDRLRDQQIDISMTNNGDPYENAVAERLNGILKYEFEIVQGFQSHVHATTAISQAITSYNTLRPHLSCDYLTPEQAHQRTGRLTKRWTKRAVKPITKPVNLI